MAYQTGTFASFASLKTTIETFATTNGWTLTSGILHKGSVAAQLSVPDAQALQLDFSDAQDGVGNLISPHVRSLFLLDNFGGPTSNDSGLDMQFPVTYHLFEFGAYNEIICVINYNTDYIQQMSFGEIKKYGTWLGGTYGASTASERTTNNQYFYPFRLFFYAASGKSSAGGMWTTNQSASNDSTTNPNHIIKCDIDGGEWLINSVSRAGFAGENRFYPSSLSRPYTGVVNQSNLQPALAAPMILMGRPSDLVSVVGTVPNVRHVNVAHYNIADIVTIGGVKWMVFPMQIKTFSLDIGFAVKYEGP